MTRAPKWLGLIGIVALSACGGPQHAVFCGQGDIVQVIEANQTAVVGCYNSELKKNSQLKGKVVMSWRIGLDGKTRKVKVSSSTLKNKAVEDCLLRQLKGAHFPKPDGGMCQIRYPFVFSSH